jgi:hypothetical protein
MAELEANDEIQQLTASQRSMMRKALRSGLEVSDREFERTARFYKRTYAISSAAIRLIAEGLRPNRKQVPKVPKRSPTPRLQKRSQRQESKKAGVDAAIRERSPLSTGQKSAIRKAYRESIGSLSHRERVGALYEKFGPLYGISLPELEAVVNKITRTGFREGGGPIVYHGSLDGVFGGILPEDVSNWIDGLASDRKRGYARDYATARIDGADEPSEPDTIKPWPEQVRRKIDGMLQAHLTRSGIPAPDGVQSIGALAGQQLGLIEQDLNLLLLWHSLFHSEPLTLRKLVEVDPRQVPPDVASALERIRSFAFMDIPAMITPDEAVEELLDSFEPRERRIVESRLVGDEAATLDAIGQEFGVSRERARQIERTAKSKMAELLRSRRVVSWLSLAVSSALGPFVPEEIAREILRSLAIEWPSPTANVLLYLAGPYKNQSGWFENEKSGGQAKLASIVDATLGSGSTAPDSDLVEALMAVGTPREAAVRYLAEKAGLRRWDGDVWIRWGGSAVEKAHSILNLLGRPSAATDINDSIGESHSVGTIQNGMSQDPRFVRTGKRTWGLRQWGLEEYSGIVEEIFERLDMRGPMDQQELIEELATTFTDISVNSIKMYLATPAFVCEGGTVRRRASDDPWIVREQLAEVRGAFRTSDNELRLCVPVTADALRGSGQSVSPAVGEALGVMPGGERSFRSADGAQLVVRWRPWSTSGPDIGSIRGFLLAANAQKDDALVLVFSLVDDALTTQLIPSDAGGETYVEDLLGIRPGGPELADSVARFVGCRSAEIRSVLRNRGDGRLADAMPNVVDAGLENEIANLLAELD